MAIAFDSASQGLVRATFNNVSYTHTVSGSNVILFVSIYNQNAGGLSAVTTGGNAMTLIASKADGNVSTLYLYYYIGPTTGIVSVTRNTTTNSLYVNSASYNGASQTGVPDASASGQNTSTTTTMTATVTTVADNCWLVMGAADGATSIADGTGIHRGTIQDSVVCIFDSNAAQTPAGIKTITTTNGGTEQTNTAWVIASISPSAVIPLGFTIALV